MHPDDARERTINFLSHTFGRPRAEVERALKEQIDAIVHFASRDEAAPKDEEDGA